MKSIFRRIISLINRVFFLGLSSVSSKGTIFYFTTIRCSSQNNLTLLDSTISNSKFNINGQDNNIKLVGVDLRKSEIIVQGTNNKISFDKGSYLNNSTIIIRGNGCTITIGSCTTIGGIRIVNAGFCNPISIGSNCLFADNIELWASDTHSIVNEKNEIINKEKPVIIEDRVWVGSHVIILKGVVIHDDSIIGMGTIVTKDVPSKTISVGIPNRTIKENITWKLDH